MILDFDQTFIRGRNDELLRRASAWRLERRLRTTGGHRASVLRFFALALRNVRPAFPGEGAPTGRTTSAG
jgi:hypothetical protein